MASRHSGYLWSSVLVPITKDRVVLPTTILMYFALVRGRVFDSRHLHPAFVIKVLVLALKHMLAHFVGNRQHGVSRAPT